MWISLIFVGTGFQLTTVQVRIEDYAEKQALPQEKKKNMK